MFLRVLWHGHGLGFEPAALVHHAHRDDPDALRKQIFGYGLGWTAVLLASVLDDRRHIGRMLGTVPRGAREMSRRLLEKLRPPEKEPAAPTPADVAPAPDAPTAELARLELQGMLRGPAAYIRSRRQWSR